MGHRAAARGATSVVPCGRRAGAAAVAAVLIALTAGCSPGPGRRIKPGTAPVTATTPSTTMEVVQESPTSESSSSPTVPPGTRQSYPGPTVRVARAASRPAIDGSDRDWRGVDDTAVEETVGGKLASAASSSWRLSWDEDNLYLFVKARDPVLTQTHPLRPWLIGSGDSIGLEIGRYLTYVPDDTMVGTDRRVLIGPSETGTTLRAIASAGAKDFERGVTWGTGSALARRVAGGYVVEAAVPWSTLQARPKAGLRLSANLLQADAVPSGSRRGSLGALKSNNPQRIAGGVRTRFAWGVLVLDD